MKQSTPTARHSQKQKRKKNTSRPKTPKGPQQRGGKGTKNKKLKNVVLLFCPATEETPGKRKQAEGTASSLIKRLFCLLSRYRNGAMQPKTGVKYRIILDGRNDSTRNVEPDLTSLFAATLTHCSCVKTCYLLQRHPWQLFQQHF